MRDLTWETKMTIGSVAISATDKTYFIADIAANHDGNLQRAKELIWKAKEAGADCAKFQHFIANKIVSEKGFAEYKSVSHQRDWLKSVSEIYDQYHTRRDWTQQLVKECKKADIHFMTTPYDDEAVNHLDEFLLAYKIGSGDITFQSLIELIASKQKPVFLASGASSFDEVDKAVSSILKLNPNLCLMQCNTNYTGSINNFQYVNLRVLLSFALKWPGMILGLSDHTPGHSAVLGAVALGARVIEKHFTDDNARVGPDHKFALNPITWNDMVKATRELELALGDGFKRVEENEQETIIIQRRAMRATRNLKMGAVIKGGDFEALRPCPPEAILPIFEREIIGRYLNRNLEAGEHLKWEDLIP